MVEIAATGRIDFGHLVRRGENRAVLFGDTAREGDYRLMPWMVNRRDRFERIGLLLVLIFLGLARGTGLL